MKTFSMGVVLRCFSPREESVVSTIKYVEYAIKKIIEARKNFSYGYSIQRVDVVIPINPIFVDMDCGRTKDALSEITSLSDDGLNIIVSESLADPFSGIINEIVFSQVVSGCNQTAVISTNCASYITGNNFSKIFLAFASGAKAVGLILPDLKDLILGGCLTNTFAMWDLEALVLAGGFDLKVGNPYKDNRLNRYIQTGRTPDDIYPITGVEVPTLVRLIRVYGPCIAPIFPTIGGEWRRPDPILDPEGHAREERKMKSKMARHIASAAEMGVTLDYIKAGVITGYPK